MKRNETNVDEKVLDGEARLRRLLDLKLVLVLEAESSKDDEKRDELPSKEKEGREEKTHVKNTSGMYLPAPSFFTLTVPGSTLASIISAATIATACSEA